MLQKGGGTENGPRERGRRLVAYGGGFDREGCMFPRGVDLDKIRRMQDQIDMARPYYETIGEIMQHTDIRRHMANIARLHEERERALRGVPSEEISRRLATAGRVLDSPGVQSALEAARRASELAETQFGSEGLDAAQRIFASRVAPDPTFTAGFERAERKIREGRADEVLEEAAAVAFGEDARLTLERADKDALVDAARRQPEAEAEAPAFEIRAGVDVETVIALAELSEAELDAVEYCVGQIIRVLLLAVTVGVVVASPDPSWTQASGALGAMMAFWGVVNAARARKKERNENP